MSEKHQISEAEKLAVESVWKKGYAEGKEAGRSEGHWEGKILGLHLAIMEVVDTRFVTKPKATDTMVGALAIMKLLQVHLRSLPDSLEENQVGLKCVAKLRSCLHQAVLCKDVVACYVEMKNLLVADIGPIKDEIL